MQDQNNKKIIHDQEISEIDIIFEKIANKYNKLYI